MEAQAVLSQEPVIVDQQPPRRRTTALLSIGCAAVIAALLLPRTARTMQAVGDGCEMALAAVRGTLVHPPGFPLYTALNDVVAPVLAGDPYGSLALFHTVTQAAAVGVLAWAFLRLGTSALVGGSFALAFGLMPVALWSGVHVEVFPLHHLLAAWVVLASFAAAAHDAPAWRLTFLGLCCGIAGAHQPIAVLWAPLVLACVVMHVRRLPALRARVRQLGAMALAMAAGLTPYLLLPLRERHEPDLAFGSVQTLEALARHILRSGYGTFSYTRDPVEGAFSPLPLLLGELTEALPLALLAVPVAGALVWTRRDGRMAGALGACALHVVFILQLDVLADPMTQETARRFFPAVAMSFAVLLGVVAHAIPSRTISRRALLACAALLPPLALLPSSLRAADAAHDALPSAYLRAVSDQLPQGALFFAATDLDAFCMLYQQHGLGLRQDVVTLATGRVKSTWYREDTRTLVPFGAELSFAERSELDTWARVAAASGRRVFASHGMPVPRGFVARPVGVLMELFPAGAVPPDAKVVERLVAACARWPDALVPVDPGRRSSLKIAGLFLEAARVGARAGGTAAPEAAAVLAEAVRLVEEGNVPEARQHCSRSGGL